MNRSATKCRIHFALAMGVILFDPARADIVIQTNGKIVVGRVTQEDQPEILVASGTAQGPREVKIPRSKVGRLLRGNEEIAKVHSCGDSQLLSQWTAAYYFAGLELSATHCLERALAQDAALGEKPMVASKPGEGLAVQYAAFWNRTVLGRLAASLRKGDVQQLLSLARWTRAAGMKETASYYLRRARAFDPGDTEIKRLAADWSVALESWVQVDLTLSPDDPIVTTEIVDEGVRVLADPGKVFVTLPIRYEPPPSAPAKAAASAAWALARATLHGKDAKALYGLRMIAPADGKLKFDGSDHGPVYERLELMSGENGGGLVVLRNKLGPRRGEDDKPRSGKPRQAKLRDEALTVRSTGLAALLMEVPKTVDRLSFEWPDGGEEFIDLNYLRQPGELEIEKNGPVRREDKKNEPSWAVVPSIARSLECVNGSSPAMTAMAIHRLSRIRDRLLALLDKNDLDDEAFAAWIADVDSAVVLATGRDDDRVRVEAWNYFCVPAAVHESPALPDQTLDLFAEAAPNLQLRWVRLLSCGLRCEDCGLWWRESPGFRVPGPGSIASASQRAQALAVLGAMLRTDDASVAAAVMEVLTGLIPPVADWSFLNDASITAQRAALARVDKIADRGAALSLIQSLVANAGEETAADIASAALSLGSAFDDPTHGLLVQWRTLEASRRPAFLAALGGVDLGESVYSRPFIDLIAEATQKPGAVREAAWRLLISQLALRRENAEAGGRDRPETPSSQASSLGGSFPMLLSRSANDPLTKGVIAVAQEADPALRVDALCALVEAGYAEQAAVCLAESCKTDAERDAALSELILLAPSGCRDAVLALLGALLKKELEPMAGRVLDALSRIVAQVDRRDHWRVFAAVKSGVHLGELDELGTRLRPPVSIAVLRWLHALGHMSPQDQQRLASTSEPAQRVQRLQQIDFRRGQLVDGRYGVLAVVSTTRRLEPLPLEKDAPPGKTRDPTPRWSQPKRITLALSPLTLAARPDQDVFDVRCDDRVIGEGLILQRPQPIRGPAAYLPTLNTYGPWKPPPPPTLVALAPPADDANDERRIGPLQLPSRTPLGRMAPGTMTIDLAPCLRDALRKQGVFAEADLAGMIPDSYKITLRYGTFGSFYGCGPRRSPWRDERSKPDAEAPPEPPRPPGTHYLLNVMLVAERID